MALSMDMSLIDFFTKITEKDEPAKSQDFLNAVVLILADPSCEAGGIVSCGNVGFSWSSLTGVLCQRSALPVRGYTSPGHVWWKASIDCKG